MSISVNDNEMYRQYYEELVNSNKKAKEFIKERHIIISVNKFLQGFNVWYQHNTINVETPIVESKVEPSDNRIYCSCGGHYINTNVDRKEHEKTKKHILSQQRKAYSRLYYQKHKKQIMDGILKWKMNHRKTILSMSDEEYLICIGYRDGEGKSLLPPVSDDTEVK